MKKTMPPQYRIVDLAHRVVEVHSDALPDALSQPTYHSTQVIGHGALTLRLDSLVISVPVEENFAE